MGPAFLALAVVAQIGTSSNAPAHGSLLDLPLPSERHFARVAFRVATGGELDTNARRAVPTQEADAFSGAARPSQVVTDGLVRLLLDSQASFDLAEGQSLGVSYTLGAKRFFGEGTEDLLTHDLGLSSNHRLFERLDLSLAGTFRSSRIRNGSRDYDVGMATAGVNVQILDALSADVSGSYTTFSFRREPRFDYAGPRVGAGVTVRPLTGLAIQAHGDYVWRLYGGNALVVGTSTIPTSEGKLNQILTFCENPEFERLNGGIICQSKRRSDGEAQLSIGVSYRGGILLGGQYLLRLQRSTSDLENVDRHRISVFATVGLPLELTASVLAALQINNGVSITDTKFLAEDDENQNSVQAQLRRRLFDELYAELRYALFANQFSTADVSFIRHTLYLGLSFRTGL